MEYAKERRLAWSKQSIKTTNDELWAENMPQYILSQTNPDMRAIMEKEYRMAAAKDGDEKKDDKKDEKGEEKKDEKAPEAKNGTAEAKTEEKKDEKKEEKKEEKTDEKAPEEEKAPEKKEEKKEEKKLSAKDQVIATAAAGVKDTLSTAAKMAGETDDQMFYADFKAEMQNKRDQRVAVAAKWVAPTLANIQV